MIIKDQALLEKIKFITNANNQMHLTYQANDKDDLKNFALSVELTALKGIVPVEESGQIRKINSFPKVSVSIDKFDFQKEDDLTSQNAAANRLGIAVGDYKDDVTLQASASLDLSGVKLNSATKQYAMDGKFVLDLNARLDLAGSVENNNSAVFATLKKDGDEKAIATLSYSNVQSKGGTLSLAVDSSVKNSADGFSYIEALIDNFGGLIINAFEKAGNITVANSLKIAFYNEDGTYNQNFKGVSIQGINLVDLIHRLSKYSKPAQTAAEGYAVDVPVMIEYAGYFTKKIGRSPYILNTADNAYGFSVQPNIQTIIIIFMELFRTDASGNSIMLTADQLLKRATTLLTAGTLQTYKKNADGSYIKDSAIGSTFNEAALMYRLFVNNSDVIKKFTDWGIIKAYVGSDGTPYYKAPSMLTDEESKLIWDYMCQVKTYANYKALVGEDKAMSEELFNQAMAQFAPGVVANLFKGSGFIGADGTYKNAIDNIARHGTLSVGLSFGNGLGLSVAAKVDRMDNNTIVGTSSVNLSVSLKAKAGVAGDFSVVEIPTDTAGWAILAA